MQQYPISKIYINGFKSIRELDLELSNVNILIGANGSGKSNFIQFFKLLNKMINAELANYTISKGGANYFFHWGMKNTQKIKAKLEFNRNIYEFSLNPSLGQSPSLFINREIGHFLTDVGTTYIAFDELNNIETCLTNYSFGSPVTASHHIAQAIKSWQVFHFHDTSDTAGVKQFVDINDNSFLKSQAENMASFLYEMKINNNQNYQDIVSHVRLIADYFKDFDIEPRSLIQPLPNSLLSGGERQLVSLKWIEKHSEEYRDAHYLSDGTLRFICLATLLLQPKPPTTIILDEPEIGLHPHAINVLAAMIKKASSRTQVVVATQSPTLIDNFSSDQIIVVNRDSKESKFRRLREEELASWLEDYTLGELCQKNILGANP